MAVDIYGQSRTFRAHLYDDGVFGDFYLEESLTVPAANGSRIGIQFVSYLLPCAVVDVTVTENEPLIRILYRFNIVIGNPSVNSPPDFPPLQTVHESFPSHGFPSFTNCHSNQQQDLSIAQT